MKTSATNLAADSNEERPPVPGRRWRIAWLLGIGILVNYFDRVNLSVSHDALVGAFGISDVVFGYLSSAYNWTYAACQLPIGVILDKLGVRRVGRISTFLWSMASFAAAAAPNLTSFYGARFLLGVGEAPTFPANAKAIGLWFPPEERSFATSLFDSAAKFASALGVPLIGIVLIHVGWRWSFAFTGAISLAYFLSFWLVYRDPEDDPELTEGEHIYRSDRQSEQANTQSTDEIGSLIDRLLGFLRYFWSLLSQRKVLGLALGFGAYNYVFYMLLYWLPTYLSRALHIDLLHSFVYTSVPWILATLTDLAIGGWLVDFLIQRGADANRVRRTILMTGTAFGLGIFGAASAHTAVQALFWISISIGGLAAAAPILWSSPSLIAAPGNVGKVGGIMNFSGQLSGIFAPIITGYVVQGQHSFALAFLIPAIYLVVGIAGYVVLLGNIELPRSPSNASQ